MKFLYRNCYGLIHRPFITTTLKYKRKHINIISLVDTGADYCTFERDVGLSLGIDITSGDLDYMKGVGNKLYPIYYHNLTLVIAGYTIKTEVFFSNDFGIPPYPVLGHVGFFDHFKVLFNTSESYFFLKHIKPSKRKKNN